VRRSHTSNCSLTYLKVIAKHRTKPLCGCSVQSNNFNELGHPYPSPRICMPQKSPQRAVNHHTSYVSWLQRSTPRSLQRSTPALRGSPLDTSKQPCSSRPQCGTVRVASARTQRAQRVTHLTILYPSSWHSDPPKLVRRVAGCCCAVVVGAVIAARCRWETLC